MAKVRQSRDPDVFRGEVPRRFPGEACLLGLDLGTNCGYAFAHHRPARPADPAKVRLTLGQWDLSAGPYDSGALRFVRLRQFLFALRPDAVFFEDVRFTPSGKVTKFNAGAILARAATSCEFFGALKATVAAWCEEAGVPCGSFPIQTIKKRATGRGNANKDMVIRAANELFDADLDPDGYESTGADNVADAAFCCLLGLEEYGRGLSGGSGSLAPGDPD